MAKVDLVRDLLVKINNIFSTDMIVIKNRIVVGGKASYTKARGNYLCILNENIKQEYDALLGVDATYVINDIKKAKAKVTSAIEYCDDIDMSEYMRLYNEMTEIMNWEQITNELSDEDIANCFTENDAFVLFENDDDVPQLTASKSLFPMITKTNINSLLFYGPILEDETDLWKVYFKFDHPYFTLYMLYYMIA